MSDSILQTLSKRERQIMTIIFRLGEADAQIIMKEISEDLSNSTIRTLLRILVNKGVLDYKKSGTKFIYSPIVKKDKEKKSMLKNMLNTFFENSPYLAVSTMINENSKDITKSELDELEKMIKRLKRDVK